MSTKYPVDELDVEVRAYDTQTEKEVILIDQLKTECDFSNYWICRDYDGNLLICDTENLKDLHRR